MTPFVIALAVLLSTHVPHARAVQVTLTFRYEMQCGYPGPDPLVLRLPQTVPAALPRGSVLIDGKAAPGVSVKGQVVTLQMPPRPIVMCEAIGPGTLKVSFMRAARLANPAAGRYRVLATKRTQRFSAPVAIG